VDVTRYWLGVVSRAHIQLGVQGGFIQLNHGKKAPLQRMRVGDWIVIYSPKEDLDSKTRCRRFTAIGRIASDRIYQVDMGDGFVPYRLDVEYRQCQEAPILPLRDYLTFIQDKKHWGYAFRFGYLELPEVDFRLIACEMGSLL
jgi:predicted RNA-binding protein